VGKRARQRGREDKLRAPTSTYEHDAHGALELRGALTPATRREYAELPAASREDTWHRQVEFLFERLAVRWTAAEVEYARQKELLGRFRVASTDERAWVRAVLREHVAEHFPELEAP
jgi:hypothetical protein